MRRERRMNPKCQTRPGFDTFSAKSAHLTGLKMRRITRAVSLPVLPVLPTERIAHLGTAGGRRTAVFQSNRVAVGSIATDEVEVTRSRMSASPLKADNLHTISASPLCAMYGRRPRCKGKESDVSANRSGAAMYPASKCSRSGCGP